MSEVLQRSTPYPLGDTPTTEELDFFGVKSAKNIRAATDGIGRRCPKKGEWYLSGSIIYAYRAPNDLTTPFHIAYLVKIEHREVIVQKKRTVKHNTVTFPVRGMKGDRLILPRQHDDI